MCSPLNFSTCTAIVSALANSPAEVAHTAADAAASSLLGGLSLGVHEAVKAMMVWLAGWLLVPSTPLCPGADQAGDGWMSGCAASPAAQLRAWLLPITILVATLALLWQGIVLSISRKGEPLVQALRGLATVALWSAVGIVGTQLAMRASDAYTVWVLRQAIIGDSLDPTETLGTALASLSTGEATGLLVLGLLINTVMLVMALAQLLLMIFREGAVVLLAGGLQLAAAGSITRLTAGWLPKITGWLLALVAYKPIAASVYAAAFALLGADGVRHSLVGLAVLLLAIIALPVAMKFFNWTTGALTSGPSTVGMLGTAAAAGVHAASSLRGVGGYHVGDHASYMAEHGPGAGSPTVSPGPTPTGLSTASSWVSGPTGATTTATTVGAGVATGGATIAAQVAADAARRAADSAINAVDNATEGR